jgi:hypothetical protein
MLMDNGAVIEKEKIGLEPFVVACQDAFEH